MGAEGALIGFGTLATAEQVEMVELTRAGSLGRGARDLGADPAARGSRLRLAGARLPGTHQGRAQGARRHREHDHAAAAAARCAGDADRRQHPRRALVCRRPVLIGRTAARARSGRARHRQQPRHRRGHRGQGRCPEGATRGRPLQHARRGRRQDRTPDPRGGWTGGALPAPTSRSVTRRSASSTRSIGEVRAPRWPGQQRRQHAGRAVPRDRAGDVGRRHRHGPVRRRFTPAARPSRTCSSSGGGTIVNIASRLGPDGRHRDGGVQRGKGRPRRPDARAGQGIRHARHPRQRGRSVRDRDRT